MNTEQIFNLAITETHEAGQSFRLSVDTSKRIAGCCTTDAKNEDEYVLNILNFANNFADNLQNRILEIREHYLGRGFNFEVQQPVFAWCN